MSGSGDDLNDGFEIEVIASDEELGEEVSTAVEELTRKRKRKAEKSKAVKKQKVGAPKDAKEKKPSVASSSPAVQAEYTASLQVKVYEDASEIELNELRLPESCFLDSRKYTGEREVTHLPAFITEVAPTLQSRLAQKPANKGAPTLLVIASSALRATEIVKVLRPMRGTKGGEVAKLFAKHFKLEEHAEYLRHTSICAGVGTAGRIGRLLETTSLSLKALTHVIIDASHRDAKTMTIFDIADNRSALLRDVIGFPDLRKLIENGKVTVVLY